MIDSAEFSAAYASGFAKVKAHLLRRGVPPGHVDDMTQSAWARAWEMRHQYRRDCPITGWVHRIAFNMQIDQMGRRKNRFEMLPLPVIDARGETPNYATRIDAETILRTIDPASRSLLVEAFEYGFSHEEVGEHNSLTVPAVKARIFKAKHKLRESLSRCRHA